MARVLDLGKERVQSMLTRSGAQYLCNSGADIAGLRLWGCPYSPASASNNSAFQVRTEKELAAWMRLVRD